MNYDNRNVFAQIIQGKIKAEKLYEDDKLIAILDINPASPIHILVIPKGEYIDLADFVNKATDQEIAHYFKMVTKIAAENGAKEYRVLNNKGKSAGQSVFHFHTHILSGLNNNNLIDDNLL
ncbi:MAG: HIT domain-containing protein [Rickettsiaceae bacterium]|nr:HIT domain-containing protein [Rickettsiaceae bacterium]